MRILHLISSGGYFGAENMLINLATGLQELGLYNVIATFENANNPHIEVAHRARRNSIPVILIYCKSKLDRSAIAALRTHIRNLEIDVLHTHGYKASVYGWLAGRKLSVPLVATCHNWTKTTISLRVYAFIDLLVLKRFHRVVGVSSQVGKLVEKAGIPPERIRIIPNGVNVPSILSHAQHRPESDRIVIGAVGRLVEQKGFQQLLQVVSFLVQKFPSLKLYIVGDGPFRPELERLSETLGIRSHVTFAGEQEDMGKVYASMDIFALPSLNEGMPMALLEAMAAGKAVVASSVGGIPQVVTPDVNGLLVEPGCIESLRAALIRLMEDVTLRTALGDKAKIHVSQNYSVENMARSYADLYESLHWS